MIESIKFGFGVFLGKFLFEVSMLLIFIVCVLIFYGAMVLVFNIKNKSKADSFEVKARRSVEGIFGPVDRDIK